MKKAALYLRSSKDRSDVSIDAQRRELMEIAEASGLAVVREFVDVVESAKSEHRPGFQELIVELYRPGRSWSVIMMIDHARLSRELYVGDAFRYEAARLGVDVVFGIFRKLDPLSRVVVDANMNAMAVVHSMMSKQKGLAGMAENVRRGWRAGGRAPRGYRLVTVTTGAIREGEPVRKSKLEPSDEAPIVRRYLKARAGGMPRAQAMRDLSIPWAATSLVGMEWNALAYAGHTVWNRHNETNAEGGYVGAQKMRPRTEWQITRGTHEALITDDEAETILAELTNSIMGQAVSRSRRGISPHLLSGVLEAPDGRKWEGWADRYRVPRRGELRGRYVQKAAVDQAVVGQIVADFTSDEFVGALVSETRRLAGPGSDDRTKELQREVVQLNAQIAKAMEIATLLDDPAPATRKVNELEARRKQAADEMARLDREHQVQRALRSIDHDHVRALVNGLADDLNAAAAPRVKSILTSAVERVTLDPVTLECRIRYRIALERTASLASPRRFELLLPP